MQLTNIENKVRKEGKPHGKPPPQGTMHQKRKRYLLSNCVLHSKVIAQRVKLLLSESLGEDVNNLFRGWTKLKVYDPLVD
jgi:hypothetical protein